MQRKVIVSGRGTKKATFHQVVAVTEGEVGVTFDNLSSVVARCVETIRQDPMNVRIGDTPCVELDVQGISQEMIIAAAIVTGIGGEITDGCWQYGWGFGGPTSAHLEGFLRGLARLLVTYRPETISIDEEEEEPDPAALVT